MEELKFTVAYPPAAFCSLNEDGVDFLIGYVS
jgi:hypothetical protein